MIIIAHRGNLNGENHDEENSPSYILEAITAGFDVETDVWVKTINGKREIFLGHDEPQYNILAKFLFDNKEKLWCHAKNIEALEWLMINDFHCFWHQEDHYTITSKGFVWAYPNKETNTGIFVMPERFNTPIKDALGVCTDFCYEYKNK